MAYFTTQEAVPQAVLTDLDRKLSQPITPTVRREMAATVRAIAATGRDVEALTAFFLR